MDKSLAPSRGALRRFPKPGSTCEELVGRHIVGRVQPRITRGITDLIWPRLPPVLTGSPSKKHRTRHAGVRYLAGRGLARYRSEPDKSTHGLRSAIHHHPQNHERALNQSILPVSNPVSYPVLSQIKPQHPRLVVPFRQFLQISALPPYYPRNP